MTWMWVSIIVVLMGAKLDAELERRTAPGGPPATRRPETANALGSAQM
jgi:uncharacterized BrkB/YihY/UPF0761 family membrane protein